MALLVLVTVVIVEAILAGRWTSFYFRVGLPIFKLRLNQRQFSRGLTERLSSRFRGDLVPSLLFHPLSDREIAFRERIASLSWVRYTPVMHGLIRCIPEEGATYVIGHVNWFVVAVIGIVTWEYRGSAEPFPPIFTLFGAGLALLMYGIQAYRFRSVAEVVANGDLT